MKNYIFLSIFCILSFHCSELEKNRECPGLVDDYNEALAYWDSQSSNITFYGPINSVGVISTRTMETCEAITDARQEIIDLDCDVTLNDQESQSEDLDYIENCEKAVCAAQFSVFNDITDDFDEAYQAGLENLLCQVVSSIDSLTYSIINTDCELNMPDGYSASETAFIITFSENWRSQVTGKDCSLELFDSMFDTSSVSTSIYKRFN